MKDAFQALEDNIRVIINLVERNDYNSSRRFCTYLITTYTFLDYDDGILIFEILESVMDQIEDGLGFFEISDDVKNDLSKQIIKQLGIILTSYNNKNKEQLYDSLKEIRSIATRFQLIQCTFSKPINKKPPELLEIK
ncbi:hypothetical protein [Methanocella conradii]|uniref:hypothetical protein n=1 Tax=Methanocella conradii TaxID=1175444 RepID=UPI00157BD6F9|nr:hypothetical protein [Methanocella conradii]